MFNQKEYSKQWYIENKEKAGERNRQWQKNNPEKRKGHSKKYRENNPETIRQYYSNNREEILEKCKQYRESNQAKIKDRQKGYYKKNCKKILKQQKEYFENNREEINKKHRQYYKDNLEKQKIRSKLYRKNNYEKDLERHRKYKVMKRKTDLKYKLNSNISRAIRNSLHENDKAGKKWETLVGYNLNDLMKRLKKTMPKGYTWQDYLNGDLHIDHKIPISVFNFTKTEHIDFKNCWALSNLQLLPAKENLKKHSKLERPFQPALAM